MLALAFWQRPRYHPAHSPFSCGFLGIYNFLWVHLTFCLLKSGLSMECGSRSRPYLLIGKLTTTAELSIPDGKKDRRPRAHPLTIQDSHFWAMGHFAPTITVKTACWVSLCLMPRVCWLIGLLAKSLL